MTDLKEQFEMVLSKYFHKDIRTNGWRYKDDCTVAFCYADYVACYFELDEKSVIARNFDTTDDKMRVTTPEELELEIQKFLMSEKELIKKHRFKQIMEL